MTAHTESPAHRINKNTVMMLLKARNWQRNLIVKLNGQRLLLERASFPKRKQFSPNTAKYFRVTIFLNGAKSKQTFGSIEAQDNEAISLRNADMLAAIPEEGLIRHRSN